jgi:uncharacterized protein
VGVSVVRMRMFSWMNSKLEIRETIKYGKAMTAITNGSSKVYRKDSRCNKGVFAKEMIEAGENLAIFGGRVIPISEETGDWGIQIDEDFVINAYEPNTSLMEESFFFNHSCEPNAGIKGQIFLIAMRDILKDEEITFDYAMCLHETKGASPYLLECHCDTSNCRCVITDNDWKIPELQRKYNGWFSWYLQEKINRMKKRKG